VFFVGVVMRVEVFVVGGVRGCVCGDLSGE